MRGIFHVLFRKHCSGGSSDRPSWINVQWRKGCECELGRLAPSSGGRAPLPRDQRCQMTSHHGDRRADCESLLCRFSPLFFSLIKLEQPLSLRSRSRSEVSSPPTTILYGRCGNGIRLKFHRLCLRRRHSAIDKKQITGAAADVTPAE